MLTFEILARNWSYAVSVHACLPQALLPGDAQPASVTSVTRYLNGVRRQLKVRVRARQDSGGEYGDLAPEAAMRESGWMPAALSMDRE